MSHDAAGEGSTLYSENQTTSGARNDGVPILFNRSDSGNRIGSCKNVKGF